MPKEFTHWILAERSLNALDTGSRLHNVISLYKSAYLGGAVLPDTLLHLFFGPYSVAALDSAHRFHDACGNSYVPLIRAESGFQDGFPDDTLACILGVISHMLADIVFHPFVYSLAGINDIGRHYRLETDLDMYFVRQWGTPINRLAAIVTPESRKTFLGVIMLLFAPDEELPKEAVERALKLHCRFQAMYNNTFWHLLAIILANLLGSPYKEQRNLFYPISSYGYCQPECFLKDVEWRHPVTGIINLCSVDDLADQVVRCCVEIFRRIEETGSLTTALSNQPGANLLTGMYATGMKEMKLCQNRTSC